MIITKEIGVSIITAPRIIRSSIIDLSLVCYGRVCPAGVTELCSAFDIFVPAVVEYRFLVEGHRIEVAVECHLQNRW